jgi:DHA3 family tetracycline resistance protein-like MFS transporter
LFLLRFPGPHVANVWAFLYQLTSVFSPSHAPTVVPKDVASLPRNATSFVLRMGHCPPRLDPIRVFLILRGSSAFLHTLIFTVNLVYQAETVGLSPLQLVLVGTTLEMSAFLFEAPTGILADVYSRRLSVIIGVALMGIGFVIEGSFPFFVAVLLNQVLWGLGYTFTSGATEAWLADEIGEEVAGPIFLRGSQIGQIAGLLAIPLSVALATVAIQLPIVLGGLLFIGLAVFLWLAMPETGFAPTPVEERSSWQQMIETAQSGVQMVRRRPLLQIIMAVSLVVGLYSEGYDRLWTPHLLENFTFPLLFGLQPIVWFGIIRAGSSLFSIAATEIAQRKRITERGGLLLGLMLALDGAMILALLLLAWAGNFWVALIALWLFSTARSTLGPLDSAWIVRHTSGKARATAISFASQLDAIGQVVGGPTVGWIGTVVSLPAALTVSALLISPILPLLAKGKRLEKESNK